MGAPDDMPPPGDRANDRRTVVAGIAKPPVLSRGTLRALCVACLLMVAFGTLGPLGTGGKPWLVSVDAWRWIPPRQPSDLNDLITNLSVYLPVGIAFRLLARRRGRAGSLDLLAGLLASIGLSYVTEVLQQAMPARSSSMTDIYMNGIAALVGCLLAVPAQRGLRRVHAYAFLSVRVPWRLWTVMAWLSAAATVILMTVPWNLAPPAAQWGFDHGLGPADLRRFTMFLIVGLFATGACVLRGEQNAAVYAPLLLTSLLAVVLEASQSVLGAHVCSLLQALVALSGAATGCGAAGILLRNRATAQSSSADSRRADSASDKPAALGEQMAMWRGSPHVRRLACIALLGTVTYAAAASIWNALSQGNFNAVPRVNWIPFRAHFVVPFPIMLADIFEQVAVYVFLTLLCLFLTPTRGRATALMLLAGLLTLTETCEAFLGGQGADITAPLLALLAWTITTRVWKSLRPPARIPSILPT